MTGWWIAAAVVAGITLLLWLPLRLRVCFDPEITVRIRWLFLAMDPTKPKRPAKRKRADTEKQPPKKRKASLRDRLKKWEKSMGAGSLSEAIAYATQLLRNLTRESRRVLRHSRITRLSLTVTVGGEDAAQAAMNYGLFCAAGYPLLTYAEELFGRVRHRRVTVLCGYDGSALRAQGEVRAAVAPVHLLAAAMRWLWRLLRDRPAESRTPDAAKTAD